MADFGMSIWLIQRCTIKPTKDITGVDSLFEYDYMGSAEFEFGALSDSLKRICANIAKYKTIKTKHKARDGRSLIVLLNEVIPTNNAQVLAFLNAEAETPQRLKERTRLKDRLETGKGPDAWWDIENDWIAFLGEKNTTRVLEALNGSRLRLQEKGKL